MGLTPGIEVTMVKYAPMGDPLEIRLRGYELALRKDDAARIALVDVHDSHAVSRETPQTGFTVHPAFGEGCHPRQMRNVLGGNPSHVCPCWQSELWQDHAVQQADWV